ncbi:stage III sporulation protein AH [Virgibacillus natechei]|uniref:Stage III sporulation protein AH n=1 Tax=Virgibacillus natechei TaxID=1216297 RepID=A0ABS4IFT4_9BACI|nr:SpoIIIAH-like family protein [Virgibacillus natechei]MBP1969713.1 stage III sporulation protein AH [Virgibacillus natechei]UZD11438.1 SpoIIIAH-like family protein [Virgibacillus natechei]
MLKKQTVWLLTMLSLMIVLSVYYMTSDSEELAYIDDGQNETEETMTTDAPGIEDEAEAEVEDITNLGQDELFTTLRMEIQDDRSMKKDRLNDVVASSTASSEEKDQALKDIDVLEQASTNETILEETIMGTTDYQDVLVRSDSDDEKVHVHVKVDSLSETEVVNIMQMVRDEFGEVNTNVNFQPTESEEE